MFSNNITILNHPVRFSEQLYEDALKYFNDEMGFDIEDNYIREHSDELIFCFSQNKSIVDFDAWTHYEDLLAERLSFDEFLFIDEVNKRDVLEICQKDVAEITYFKRLLFEFRL